MALTKPGKDILNLANDLIPTGSVVDFAGATAPADWLLCAGQTIDSVADTTLAALFTLIGTTYGGTGASAFALPDLRGRVIIGKDDMGGTSANRIVETEAHGVNGDTLGASGGVGQHQLTEAELAAHIHVAPVDDGGGTAFNGAGVGSPQGGAPSTTGSTGGDTAHTNLQPSFILNKIIKK